MGQTVLEIRPIDLHGNLNNQARFQKVLQLETYGEHVLVRTLARELLVLDKAGKWQATIPACEEGSEAFQLLAGVSVWQKQLIALNLTRSIFFFKNKRYQRYKTSDYYAAGALAPKYNSNAFGFNGRQIVLSARSDMKALAVVLDEQGNFHHSFGQKESFPQAVETLKPAINACFWAWDGSHWYGLHKFKPLVKKYDPQFKLVKSFPILGQEIADKEDALYNPAPEQSIGRFAIMPHFSDFKIFKDSLYIMCGKALYQVDKALTQVTNMFYFKGTGPEFSHLNPATRLTLPFFTILPDATLVLGQPNLMWKHDLWLADLPTTTSGEQTAKPR